MNTFPLYPPRFRWTPEQLADAVPLRLSEVFRFEAPNARAANAPRHGKRAASYLADTSAPAPFRVS